MISLNSKIFKPWKLFIALFLGIHGLNLFFILLVRGFWDGGLAVGIPISYMVHDCGLTSGTYKCPTGFHLAPLILDLIFWFLVAITIKLLISKKILFVIFLILISFSLILFLLFSKSYVGKSNKLDLNKLGSNCEINAECKNMIGVNCNSEVDGPYYYILKETGDIVSRCGGFCMSGNCTNCPPKEWNCQTY